MDAISFDPRFNWSTGIVKKSQDRNYTDYGEIVNSPTPFERKHIQDMERVFFLNYIKPCFPDKHLEYDHHGIVVIKDYPSK